jgi:hypothetical protein
MPGNNQFGFVPGNYPVNQSPPNQSSRAIQSVSHSLDVRIALTTSTSHSLDAYIQNLVPASHSLDVSIVTSSILLTYFIPNTGYPNEYAPNEYIFTGKQTWHSLGAYLVCVRSTSHTLDAYIKNLVSSSHSLDVDILEQTDQSHFLDTLIATQTDQSHQLDVFIKTTISASHSLSAYVAATTDQQHHLNAYIAVTEDKLHSLDGCIAETADQQHYLDVRIALTEDKSHFLDSVVQTQLDISHSLDACVATQQDQSHFLDSVVQTQQDQSHSLDACAATLRDQFHFLDAYVTIGFVPVVVSHDLDTYIQALVGVSHSLDVFVLLPEVSVSHQLDAVIPSVYLRDHTLDVYISFEYTISHSLSAYIFQLTGRPSVTTKDILLPSIKVLLPNQSFVDENNCVSANFTLNLTGGNFSISLMRDTAALPSENTILTLPIGRLAVVKNIGRGLNNGGLLDTISGPIVPYAATIRTFVAMLTDNLPIGSGLRMLASVLAGKFGVPAAGGVGSVFGGPKPISGLSQSLLGGYFNVVWEAPDYEMRSFNFRGITLQGLQQLASNFLYDVIVYKNNVYIVAAGESLRKAQTWTVNDSDLISVSQTIDFSSDFPAYLNPLAIDWEGAFVFDEKHAQKQGRTTVQAGANLGTGGADFIPIPDGWMVEGQYEEWTPTPGSTDLSNPNASVPKYWKVLPSPSTPGAQRGIISFTKLLRDLNLAPNLSKFVATPITEPTQSSPNTFTLRGGAGQNGLFGFSADEYIVKDVLTDKETKIKNATILTPGSSDSGKADENFYSVPLEFWTFGKVVPTSVLPEGADPTNPNKIPPDVELFTPSSSVKFNSTFINNTLRLFAKKNSPKMQTSVSQIYHGQIPQPGDKLVVTSADIPVCGRINSVTLNITRGGVTISISAEILGEGTIKGQLATV